MKCRFGIIEILCLLSYLSIALPIQAQSQTQIHLQGNVKDAKTNELLEFATVLLKNDSVQFHAISDTKGSFSIKKVPTGTYSLSISFIGYTRHINPYVSTETHFLQSPCNWTISREKTSLSPLLKLVITTRLSFMYQLKIRVLI